MARRFGRNQRRKLREMTDLLNAGVDKRRKHV